MTDRSVVCLCQSLQEVAIPEQASRSGLVIDRVTGLGSGAGADLGLGLGVAQELSDIARCWECLNSKQDEVGA